MTKVAAMSGIRNTLNVSTIRPAGEAESSANRGEHNRWLQHRDKVQIPLEDQRQWRRIEMKLAKNRHRSNAASIPGSSPFGFGPVAERQSNAVSRISDPIHHVQNQRGGKPVTEVILDHDRSPSHSLHLLHQPLGISRVMKHVDCYRDV